MSKSLKEVRSTLNLYWKYKKRKPVTSKKRDAREAQTLQSMRPLILEQKLKDLVRIAEYSNLGDSWWDYLDSTLTVEENVTILQEQLNAKIPPELSKKYGGRYKRAKKFDQQEQEQEGAEPQEMDALDW